MRMNKKLLAVAVGAALGGSAVSMNAQADALLFPVFLSAGNAAFTLLSLRGDGNGVAGDPNPIHYTWNYTKGDDQCVHANADGLMTSFDLVQQTVVRPDLGANLDLPAAFGDQSTVNYLNVGGVFGFVIVQDNSPEGAFGGQGIIIDNVTGTVSGYKALNEPTDTPAANPLTQVNFDSILTSHISHDLTWYPIPIVDTSWFYLVTGTQMTAGAGWFGAVTLDSGFDGVYDRDENFRSGEKTLDIVCNALVTLPDLLTADQLVATELGGHLWATQTIQPDNFVPGGLTSATGTLAYKVETTTALGPVKTAVSPENAFPNFPY